MKYVSMLFAIILGALGFAATYKDVMADDRPWHVIGEVWFAWAPSSLQVTEAIVSRYIDPCGAIVALGCEPFLWHPIISTMLNWYAAPIFLLSGLGFALLGRWLGKRKPKIKVKA
ncbi:MAG: hypothetical protein J4F41_10170 [Alphaproteobacteria bacterium]|nr:hypothetical protein [Alphaproteobacteria bacterium]